MYDDEDDRDDKIQGEDVWTDVHLGADLPAHAARVVSQDGGTHLHGYLKFRVAGGQTYLLTMSVDLRPITAQIEAEMAAREPGGAEAGGRFRRRLKKVRRRIRKAVKKIAHNKIVKGLAKVAKKVVNNPLVKGMIAAVPGGAAVLAVQAAAKVAARAVRGSRKARRFMQTVAHRVRSGDRNALQVARLLKQGIKQAGIARHLRLPRGAAAGGESAYLGDVLSACAAGSVDPYAISSGHSFLVGVGADVDDDGTDEMDAVETVATSGAFEGVRWIASRLGLHSMQSHAAEFSARDALMLGHQLMAQPRH